MIPSLHLFVVDKLTVTAGHFDSRQISIFGLVVAWVTYRFEASLPNILHGNRRSSLNNNATDLVRISKDA